jgi:ATP-dependent DNA helicase DinG
MEANSEMKENEASIRSWEAFSLQEAIMDLKQGGGRLIRAENDRGIVAILDKRAYKSTKKYSRKIRGALPHPETYDKEMVLQVLRAFGSQAVAAKR